MESLPTVTLMPHHSARLRHGHPWLYANEVKMSAALKQLPAGSLVWVQSSEGYNLGTAIFNPHSLIVGRLVSRQKIATLDEGFFAGKLRRALELRQAWFKEPYFRLIHAEADGLPGVIIDLYGTVVVVQLNTAGMSVFSDSLLAALTLVLSPTAVLLRNDSAARESEGLEREVILAQGKIPPQIEVRENGAVFLVDLQEGQKTGWFYDQRENRRRIGHLARGGRVLDVFCYLGGFGIEALVAGAESATLVDRSESALAAAVQSAERSQVAARCSVSRGEGFEVMAAMIEAKQRFDLVVVDPPAFVKSKKHLAVGLKAYSKMTEAAAELVTPGGYLLAASCSHNVSPDAFAEAVSRGLSRAERSGRILFTAGADYDHPVHPHLPESAYLKAICLVLD
ncbi:MAG: class I SAM-dependent rRNA methyltransferase [Candidatus Pacebacteria bacterium]|nr:class I SAM-dependent rRNA methyltransferase [Candidatus Paceibacterota bacterium]